MENKSGGLTIRIERERPIALSDFCKKNGIIDPSFQGVPHFVRSNLVQSDQNFWHTKESIAKSHNGMMPNDEREKYIKRSFMNYAAKNFHSSPEAASVTPQQDHESEIEYNDRWYATFESWLGRTNSEMLAKLRVENPNLVFVDPFTQQEFTNNSFLLYLILDRVAKNDQKSVAEIAGNNLVVSHAHQKYTRFVTDQSMMKRYYDRVYEYDIGQAQNEFYKNTTQILFHTISDLNTYLDQKVHDMNTMVLYSSKNPDITENTEPFDVPLLTVFHKYVTQRNFRNNKTGKKISNLEEMKAAVKFGISNLYELGISAPLKDPENTDSDFFTPDSLHRYALGIAMFFGKRPDLVDLQRSRRAIHLEQKKARHLETHQKGKPFVSSQNPAELKKMRNELRKDSKRRDQLVLDSGLDIQALTAVWDKNYNRSQKNRKGKDDYKSFGEYISKNWNVIAEIESLRPGAALALYNKFGIANFARYTAEILIDQYDNKDDKDVRYFVAVSALDDHNEAMSLHRGGERKIRDDLLRRPHNYVGVNRDLYEQLRKNGIHLRVYEVADGHEIMKKLVEAGKKYNALIAGAMIEAHGTEESMLFSIEETRDYFMSEIHHEVTLKDLAEQKIAGISRYFEEKATLILRSCKTGIEGGIADKLHRSTGLRTIGPSTNTNISQIQIGNIEDDTLKVDIKYYSGESMVYE